MVYYFGRQYLIYYYNRNDRIDEINKIIEKENDSNGNIDNEINKID
jgi:hypothetical protein